MSLAENLLNTLNSDNAIDSQDTNDIEEPIIVDETRKIIVPDKLKMIAVTGDKDVETVTFNCIRYWDAVHDLSNFVIYINYILPNNETGTYIPTIKERYEDYFTFDWVIGREITKYKGTLTFLILARKVDSNGVLDYQWSSLINSECTIAQGIDIINVTDDVETEDKLTLLLQLPLENGMGLGNLLLNAVETNFAGCMGYYWKSIDLSVRKIYLSREQVTNPTIGSADYTDETFGTPGYAVGDKIAVVNNNKFFPEATITAINHNVITYSGDLGFSSIIPVDSGTYDVDDYSLFVLAKPEVGMVPIKRAALSAGQRNKALGNASAAMNTDNEVYGDHGFAYNYGNKAAWAASAGGYGNESNGFYSDTVGRDNVNDAECGRMAGRGNKATENAYGADVSGNGNTADSDYVHIAGKGNKIENGVQKSTGSSADGEGNSIQGAVNSRVSGKWNRIDGSTVSNQWGGAQSDVGGLGNTLDGTNTGATNVHMHGENNIARHRNADVGGKGNRSSALNQTVRGAYNTDNSDALLIVGNGTGDTARSNALEVISRSGGVSLKVGKTEISEESFEKILNEEDDVDGEALNTLLAITFPPRYALSGAYQFHEHPNIVEFPGGDSMDEETGYSETASVTFTSDGTDFIGMCVYITASDQVLYFVTSEDWRPSAYDGDKMAWDYPPYMTVDFGTVLQEVTEEFYTWFTNNATPAE